MADAVLVNLHHGAGVCVFHGEGQSVIDVLLLNGVSSHRELHQVLYDLLRLGDIDCISDDLERPVPEDHGHVQGALDLFYMLVKLTEYVLLVLCRNFCNRFNDAHESVLVLSTRFPVL